MVTSTPKPPSIGPRSAYIGNAVVYPPKKRKASKMLPVRTEAEFANAHRMDAERTRVYVNIHRRGSRRPDASVMQFMHQRYAPYLRANSPLARLSFVEPWLRYVKQHIVAQENELLFVSITPRAYILSQDSASKIDLERLKAFSRQAVGNSDGFGMIEAALYRGCDAYGPRYGKDVVAWHAHMIVWNKTHAQLRAIADRLGPQHVNISGRKCVWIRSMSFEELDLYARYIVKAPLNYYRLQTCRGETVDDSTGEVFVNCKQKKDRMRSGDTVRMANVMKDMFLQDLVFGSGAGTPIVRDLVHEVTAVHRRADQQDQNLRPPGMSEMGWINPSFARTLS